MKTDYGYLKMSLHTYRDSIQKMRIQASITPEDLDPISEEFMANLLAIHHAIISMGKFIRDQDKLKAYSEAQVKPEYQTQQRNLLRNQFEDLNSAYREYLGRLEEVESPSLLVPWVLRNHDLEILPVLNSTQNENSKTNKK